MGLISIDDYEAAAREKLSQMAYDYIAGGSDDEVTVRENRSAYDRYRLGPRMLAGVGTRDLSTTVMGQTYDTPIGIAPTAYHRLCNPDGEMATARAAGAAGTVMCASTWSTCSLEEIAEAATGTMWFQLYVYKDR